MPGNVSHKQIIFIIGYFLSSLWWIILRSIYSDSLFCHYFWNTTSSLNTVVTMYSLSTKFLSELELNLSRTYCLSLYQYVIVIILFFYCNWSLNFASSVSKIWSNYGICKIHSWELLSAEKSNNKRLVQAYNIHSQTRESKQSYYPNTNNKPCYNTEKVQTRQNF